jgi:O-antigen/teichoic acid export membrane protein
LLAWSDLARERGFADGAMAWSYQAAGLARFGGVALLSGISLLLVLADARRRKLWGGFLIAVLVLDVWLVGRHFNPAADPKLLAFEPPVLAWLQEQRDADQPWRFTTFDAPGEKILNANSAMRFGLEDVRGYDSIILKQYVNYMDRIQPQEGDLLYNRIGPILTQWGGQSNYGRLDSPLLTLLGVRYVVTTHTIPNPGYTLAYPVASDGESTAGVGEVRVYRNERAMPRAFVVPEALVAADQQEALTLLERIDPAETVVVEGIAPGSLPPRSSPEVREARISNRTDRELFIDVNISDRGWLVLTDSYFDGWKAYLRPYGAQGEGVDSSGESIETQLPIYRADGTFRAVYLPEAGQWTVRFVYSPRSVLLGVYASFLSVLSIFVLLGWWLWGRYYRGNGSELGTVAKNTSVQLGLSLVNKGIDFAFAMLRLRVLTPAGEGSYAFAITFYTLFEIVTRFGLGTLVTRDVALDKSRTRSYLVNTVALRSGLWLLSLPVMAIAIYFYRVTLGQMTNQELAAILLFSVAMLFALWADSISAVFYAHEKMEYPAGTSTAIAIGKVALGGLVILPPLDWGFVGLAGVSVVMNLVQTIWLYVLLDRNVLAPAAAEGASPEEALAGAAALGTIDETSATAAVAEASAAATVMRMGPSGTPTGHARGALDPSLQRYMLRESGPLMINHLLATLFWRISQLVLRAATNPASLGIFSAGVKYLDGLNVIPAYFTLAIFPVMSRYARSGTDSLPKAYRLALQVLLMTALPIAVFVTFASEPLIRILGGAAYLPDSAIALRIMIWSIPIGFMNSVTQYVLIAVNQQRFLTRAFLIGVAFSATANILLVPRYGYVAAAAVLIPAELSLFIPFAAAVQRYVAHMPWVRLLAPPAIATLANLGATWLAVRVGVPMLLACGIGFAGYAGLLALSGVFRSEEFVPLRAMLRRNLLGVRNRMAGSGPPG